MTNPGNDTPKDRLWTRNYIFICIASFLMSFSFFILVPTLPFYLRDTFGIGQSMIGFVLSCYTIAVLSIRPFSGFLADTFPRKRVYIIAYCLFVATFFGYFAITTGAVHCTENIPWIYIRHADDYRKYAGDRCDAFVATRRRSGILRRDG